MKYVRPELMLLPLRTADVITLSVSTKVNNYGDSIPWGDGDVEEA